MRTVTNKANLPRPMFNALALNTYVGGGDTSTTRLIKPPRIVTLQRHHEDEIEEDATDRIWSLLGSSTHRMLELSAGDDVRVEHRLSMKVSGIEIPGQGIWDWIVTTQPDVLQGTELFDYKVTSVWSVLFGKIEWEYQLNIQAAIHRHHGDEITAASIVAVLRDWQKSKARFEKEYPRVAVQVISSPLWTQEEAMMYITRRVKLHQKAQLDYEESGQDESVLPMCTEEERWYRGGGFAVKKRNTKTGVENKKADRVCTSLTDARQFISDNPLNRTADSLGRKSKATDKEYFVEERKGEFKRCLDYCDVWRFCKFGRQVHEEREKSLALVNENGNQPEDE